MHDCAVAGCDDILVVENDNLCLEPSDGVNRLFGRGENEADRNVLIFDSAQSNTNVVTAVGVRDFLFNLVDETRDLHRCLVGAIHEPQL